MKEYKAAVIYFTTEKYLCD